MEAIEETIELGGRTVGMAPIATGVATSCGTAEAGGGGGGCRLID